jgi:hypothetical protein
MFLTTAIRCHIPEETFLDPTHSCRIYTYHIHDLSSSFNLDTFTECNKIFVENVLFLCGQPQRVKSMPDLLLENVLMIRSCRSRNMKILCMPAVEYLLSNHNNVTMYTVLHCCKNSFLHPHFIFNLYNYNQIIVLKLTQWHA